MKIKPIKQGVDGLCGVYAVMNSIHIALGLSTEEIEWNLFPALIEPLKSNLHTVLTEGTLRPEMEDILSAARKYVLKAYDHTFSFKRLKERPDNVEVWLDTINMHLDRSMVSTEHNAQSRSVISSFIQPYGHWTVIRDVDDDYIHAFDSYNIKKIRHSRIFFSGSRDYVFCPDETYFITIGE